MDLDGWMFTMTDEEILARTQGRTTGEDTNYHAGDCPYLHSRLSLRLAWMNGFSDGRKSIALQAAEQSGRPTSEKAEV